MWLSVPLLEVGLTLADGFTSHSSCSPVCPLVFSGFRRAFVFVFFVFFVVCGLSPSGAFRFLAGGFLTGGSLTRGCLIEGFFTRGFLAKLFLAEGVLAEGEDAWTFFAVRSRRRRRAGSFPGRLDRERRRSFQSFEGRFDPLDSETLHSDLESEDRIRRGPAASCRSSSGVGRSAVEVGAILPESGRAPRETRSGREVSGQVGT